MTIGARTLDINALGLWLIALLFATGCAGSREKQATSVTPTPGKKTESSEAAGSTPGTQVTPGEDDEGSKPSTTTDVTDLQIDAELDNGDSTNTTLDPNTTATQSGPWDGKSFRGLGKWKVTPG